MFNTPQAQPQDMATIMKDLAMIVASMKDNGSFSPQAVYKHTTPSGTPSTPYMHGPGGLFGVAGLERDVISTRVQPRGLASVLPVRLSTKMNPLYAYITGFRDVSGSNPTTVCSDGQTAGPLKNCIQTAQFGRYTFMTRELEVNRVGQQTDRAEFFDLRLVNDPLVQQMGGLFPGLPAQDQILAGREMVERMLEVGVAFQNKLVRQLYTGNPANNAAGGGYKEFPGLDILIGTNKVDALTNTDCPSLDSDVKDFNYGKVDADNLNPDIVNVATYLYRYLTHNAEQMGFGETRWAITMRNDLFYELTAIWPCSYLTYRCKFRASDGTVVNNVNAADQVAMRDTMRRGRYLLIDGDEIPVVIDDGIVEESSGDTNRVSIGCYASDIYFIPLTVRGGYQVTFWEAFDYANGTMQAIRDGRYDTDFWTDGGRYLWHKKPPTNWCVQLISKIEPRIILLTPHLAGRITNVQYCPLQHTRDSLPSDDYFVNGGVYTPRAAPSLYSDWTS